MNRGSFVLAVALVFAASIACNRGPAPTFLGAAPVFEPGFFLYPSPRTFDGPGTIFRIDKDGERSPIADLSPMVRVTPGEEVIPRIVVSGRVNASALFAWVGHETSVKYSKGDSAVVEIFGTRREITYEADRNRVVDSAEKIIDWSRPGRVYLITEAILADSVNVHLRRETILGVGDSIQRDTSRARALRAYWSPSRATDLAVRFLRPHRVLYKAEQIVRTDRLEPGSRATLRVPVASPLWWGKN